MPIPHTKDIGTLIADMIGGHPGVECHDWDDPECPYIGDREADVYVDASHGFDNLRVTAGNATFRVTITREG